MNTVKAKFINLTYFPKCQFVEIASEGERPKKVIGRTPSGTTLYIKRETRVIMLLAAPKATPLSYNIYSTIKKAYPHRNVNQGFINTLQKHLDGMTFEIENGEILHLEETLKSLFLY